MLRHSPVRQVPPPHGLAVGAAGGNGLCPDSPIRFTRAAALVRLWGLLDTVGVPAERLLNQAGIPPSLIVSENALVPTELTYRLAELTTDATGIPSLVIKLGENECAYDFGRYGAELRRAVTVYDYLKTGIERVGTWSSGVRLWLSREGDRLRFNQFTYGKPLIGRSLADLYTLTVTLAMLRRFLGEQWRPGDLRLMTNDPEVFGPNGRLFGAPVLLSQPHSSFTLPVRYLGRPIPPELRLAQGHERVSTGAVVPIPEDFIHSVETAIEVFLAAGRLDIDTVAEAAGLTRRSFQRRLLSYGVSYRRLVNQTRMRLAAQWLARTDLHIADIAAALGYRDPSNFTRAFCNQAGTSPRSYRCRARP